MIKRNFRKVTISTSKAYYFAMKEILTILAHFFYSIMVNYLHYFLNPLQDCKSSNKRQSQTMYKIETTSKVSLKLTSRVNLERRDARAQLSTLGTAHNSPHSLERPNHTQPLRKGAQRTPPNSDQIAPQYLSVRLLPSI